jgi:RNA polymerase sigma factor (sigma-70 family)
VSEARDRELASLLPRLNRSPADEEAWFRLYQLLRPLVFSIVYSRLRGVGTLAEDATQEVFIRLARARPFDRINGSKELRAYVWTVAENVAKTYLKQLTPLESEPSPGHEPSVPPAGDAQLALDEIMRGLGPQDQKLLRMAAQGHSLQEISQAMGLGYSAVGVRLHRLRQALRAHREERVPESGPINRN